MGKKLLFLVVFLSFMVSAGTGRADSPQGVITIEVEPFTAVAGMGVKWVEGVLTFRGRPHRFKVKGLKSSIPGVDRISVKGEVYNLREASDLAGTYRKAEPGVSSSSVGQKELVVKNDQGVVIKVRVIKKRLLGVMRTIGEVFKKEGVPLDIVPEGLTITRVQ